MLAFTRESEAIAILVVGGAGYIGSHMVKQLLEEDEEEIVVLDNLSTGFRDAILGGEVIVSDFAAVEDAWRWELMRLV